MHDPRLDKLADILINYSIRLQQGESILVEALGAGDELLKAVIRKVYEAGGYPHIELTRRDVEREWLLGATPEQMRQAAGFAAERMKAMDAYIGIRGADNINELTDVPPERMKIWQEEYWSRVHLEQRVPHTRWVVLRYPNASMAQLAQMSTESFEDFYFDVCTLDYARMDAAMEPLIRRMQATDHVRIKGPGTDLSFSIKDIPVIPCSGQKNLPDGECFTAPVRESVNGVIQFNTPTVYQGRTFSNIRLEFRDGRIIEAAADDLEALNRILDTDEGARYAGEFSLAFNPRIVKPMNDILFDEKISGSFHFTPGSCYDEAFNGNKSVIHWDLVCIQRPEYGGGEIWFDGELVRKDGLFITEDLAGLNPDRLQ